MSADPRIHQCVRTLDVPDHARAKVQGSSLVELMTTIVLTVIGVVAIMEACIRLHALQRLDDELAHAYGACRANLEDLRATPLSDLLALNGSGFAVVGRDGVTPILTAVPGDPDGLPGHIAVREERKVGTRSLYRIEVSVRWRGAAGNHTVPLTTMWGGVP